MSEDLFPYRLKLLRSEKNISLEYLANKVGTSKAALSRYEKGERSPKIPIVGSLANFFGVNVAWLAGLSDEREIKADINEIYNQLEQPRQEIVYNFAEKQLEEQNNKVIHHDFQKKRYGELRGALSAGTGISNYYEDITDEETFDWKEIEIPADAPRNFDYVYVVSGNSMEPMFYNEDIVYVKELTEAERSSLDTQGVYVVRVNGESYIKKIRFTDDKMHLISLNKDYEDILVTEFDSVKVVAKVIL